MINVQNWTKKNDRMIEANGKRMEREERSSKGERVKRSEVEK